MTNSSRNILLSMLFVAVPALAVAQTPPAKPVRPAAAVPAATPRPRAVVTTPSHTEQFQRQVDRQQLQNAQNQSNVRQQLQQHNTAIQRSNATDPAMRNQLDNAQRSQQQLDRAQQDSAARQYETKPSNRGTVAPSRPSTSGQ